MHIDAGHDQSNNRDPHHLLTHISSAKQTLHESSKLTMHEP